MSRIPTKIGKYPVEEKIAEGGMGAVFKGTHPTLEQPVVLKKLTLNDNEQITERFRREARIMMEFSHENIVRVYDHFKQASSYYIVQEYVDGPSVDILLKKERYLTTDVALYIFYHACKALKYAHNRQVIHRDIKPANIMVSRNGEIKLVDFGIAQAESEEDTLTREGMALGTPSYMAPEQFEDSRNVTSRADIYSLGVMLYEMLTGKKPYPGRINPETIARIQKGKFTSPRKLNPAIPRFLAGIIRSCMQPRPDKRADSVTAILRKLDKWYHTAPQEEIRRNLIHMINDEPVEGLTSPAARGKIRMRLVLPAVLLLILTAAGGFSYYKGYHYRYILNREYGGFFLELEMDDSLKKGSEIHISTSIFEDDNQSIPDVDKPVRFGISEETGDGYIRFRSDPVYLPPGTYRIKTVVDEEVIWRNFYLEPMNPDRKLFNRSRPVRIRLEWPGYRPSPLNTELKAFDRYSGREITEDSVLTIQFNREYQEIGSIGEKLYSGNVYKFRVESEGYYRNDYHLKIHPNQSTLILEAWLVPLEGHLKISGMDPSVRLKINGSRRILTGGFPGDYTDLKEWNYDEPIPLNPTDYQLIFSYKGSNVEIPVTVKGSETVSLTVAVDEKEKAITVSKE